MAEGRQGRVLVVGDVMTDIICKPEGPLVVGSDRRATIRSRAGGSGANQAVWMAAFGLDVRFAGRVGAADVPMLRGRFAADGVEAVLAADSNLPSGMIVTIVGPDGERSFLTDRGASAALSMADLPDMLLDGCQKLIVSGYALFEPVPRQAVMRLFETARRLGVPAVVDPASTGFLQEVGPANFLGWTKGVTTIFANEAEAALLTGESEPEAQMTALGRAYPNVALKLGAAGAAIGGANGIRLLLAARNVDVVDTTGAGDAFAAAFIAAELEGEDLELCLARAIASGSEAVTHFGARPVRRLG
ncbi:MAG: PfkB family carbohydrate kinase [Devosia sp.]